MGWVWELSPSHLYYKFLLASWGSTAGKSDLVLGASVSAFLRLECFSCNGWVDSMARSCVIPAVGRQEKLKKAFK